MLVSRTYGGIVVQDSAAYRQGQDVTGRIQPQQTSAQVSEFRRTQANPAAPLDYFADGRSCRTERWVFTVQVRWIPWQ
jgi:hypothetical protein